MHDFLTKIFYWRRDCCVFIVFHLPVISCTVLKSCNHHTFTTWIRVNLVLFAHWVFRRSIHACSHVLHFMWTDGTARIMNSWCCSEFYYSKTYFRHQMQLFVKKITQVRHPRSLYRIKSIHLLKIEMLELEATGFFQWGFICDCGIEYYSLCPE